MSNIKLEESIMDKTFEIKYDQQSGVINLIVDNEIAGKIGFTFKEDKKIIIDSTDVQEKHSGKGYGKILVNKAVDFARENNLKIIPECPFAKRILELFPEYKDVLN
ncbi:MAG: family N-acetyltransferase [Bacteroidetes bacterium]|nr:family N-acetyltransferase [Bacteroidota bacterium]